MSFADTITNFMSPIVSYQYPEDFSSGALTNGGILSPIVSYQYEEWPSNNVLQLLYSKTVSYFYQSSVLPGSVMVQGTVTDANGAGISSATVSLSVGLTLFVAGATGSGGSYALPPVGSGTYVLTATASGYGIAARALTLSGSSSVQNFQLTALPATPSVQQSARQAPAGFIPPTTDQWGSTLKIYDGTTVTNITANNKPSPNLMTIVLTHGWTNGVPDPSVTNTPFADWPLGMARQLWMSGLTPQVANILVWDWRYAAMSSGIAPSPNVLARIPPQGEELGMALQGQLGASYSGHLHIIGHSLGTMVNAAAINYLHGDQTATEPASQTPWKGASFHVTLFDNAEVASVLNQQAIYNGITASGINLGTAPLDALVAAAQTSLINNWMPSMPVSQPEWADNYISEFGVSEASAVNVYLQNAADYVGSSIAALHGYPIAWYSNSIASPADSILGFYRSEEYLTVSTLQPPSFLTWVADFPPGISYSQIPFDSDQLALSSLSTPPVVTHYGVGAFTVVKDLTQGAVAEVNGAVLPVVEDQAQAAWQWTENGFNSVVDSAGQGVQNALINLYNTPVLGLNLGIGSLVFNSQLQAHTLSALAVNSSDASSTSPPMAWLPVQISSNAAAMAFDFVVSGNPSDDVMVCGIGTNQLFSLEAKYIPTNSVSASWLLDVSAWAGTSNELFFGLLGGTATNAAVLIDNIRFYSLQADSVGDGIPDSWRAQYFPNVDLTGTTTNYLSCATCDADGTGQNNLFKYVVGLDPTNPASVFVLQIQNVPNQPTQKNLVNGPIDNGCTYVVESTTNLVGGAWSPQAVSAPLTNGTQVTVMDPNANTPSKFYRIDIYNIITNIANTVIQDSVGDGIADSWRAQYFANQPTNNVNGTMTNSQSCATCDADGTGQNNFFKYIAGLDPTNPASVFVLSIASTSHPSQNNLFFNPLALGRRYVPEFNTNLVSGVWLPLTTYTGLSTNGNQITITDTNPIPPREFYRIGISSP